MELIVHNPVAVLDTTVTPRAPRISSLEGIDFGLWWNKKVGGDVAIEWLGEEFKREYGVTNHKFYDSFPCHEGMTDKATRAKAVVGSTGD